MKLVNAIIQVLKEAGEPLHITEITERILDANLWESSRKKPEATVGSYIYLDIKNNGKQSIFVKIYPQIFSLRDSSIVVVHEEKTTFSFIDSAEKVLKMFGDKQPMHYRDIAEKAMELGWLQTNSKKPLVAMHSHLLRNSKSKNSRFFRISSSCYSLIEWVEIRRPRPKF